MVNDALFGGVSSALADDLGVVVWEQLLGRVEVIVIDKFDVRVLVVAL